MNLSAFRTYPSEAISVGRLLMACGEIEYEYALSASLAMGMDEHQTVIKSLYRLKQTSGRIDVAETLLHSKYDLVGLREDLFVLTKSVRDCVAIRNRYAHCHWTGNDSCGLFFGDLEAAAQKSGSMWYDWKHVTLDILKAQEAYFDFTSDFLIWLRHEFWTKGGTLSSNLSPKPQTIPLPIPHSLRSQHVPPWLPQESQDRYIAHALECEARDRERANPPAQKRAKSQAKP